MKLPSLLMPEKIEPKILLMDKVVVTLLIRSFRGGERQSLTTSMPFYLVNVIMANTMLPRLAIIRIIKGLSAEARNKINNQDYLEEAIKTINKLLKEFKSKEFLTAELIEGVGALEKDIFEVDKIVNEDEIKYLFTPNPAHKKAMNLKYKFDSEGEWKFAKALDDDPNVMLYTKLKKGGFVLETPAGNYSPD